MRRWTALACIAAAHANSRDTMLNNLESGKGGILTGLEMVRDIFIGAPPPPTPATTVKVFVAGLPRTGTGSITLALKELGFNPVWGPDVAEFADEAEAVFAGKMSKGELLDAFGARGYDAAGLDVFGHMLWREAADIPGVKLILTERPVGGGAGWAESIGPTVAHHATYFTQRPLTFIPAVRKLGPWLRNFDPLYGPPGALYDQAGLAAAYDKHQAEVKETYARLGKEVLVYNVKDGWAPLCKFLEIEACPQTPFPRQNDREVMIAMTNTWWALTWVWPLVPLLAIFFAFVLCTCCCACGADVATLLLSGPQGAHARRRASSSRRAPRPKAKKIA